MSGNDLYNSVREYLASHYMYVVEEWLLGCVEFLTSDTSNSISETQIKNLAKEQWLLNDLKDICPGSLPADLQRQAKTVLTGKYMLQLNAAIDIGTPAYQQYLKLQKVNMENVDATTKFEDKISSHRMMKLYLTDGVQEVTAIEYKAMRNLSVDLTPGCKILIKGPIECRRGMIFLTENNIELLGGEVAEIFDANCLAALLSSKLGLPAIQESQQNTTAHHPHNFPPTSEPEHTTKPVAIVASLQTCNDDIDLEQISKIEQRFLNNQSNKRPYLEENTEPEKKFKSVNRPEEYPDDDMLFNEDEELLRQIEDEFATAISNDATVRQAAPTNVNSRTDTHEIVNNCNKNIAHINSNQRTSESVIININEQNINNKMNIKQTAINNIIRENSDSLNKKIDTNDTLTVAIQPLKYPIDVSSQPYVYIKQILDLSDTEKAGRVFTVKAQIMRLLSKLNVGKDGWCLKCTIADGTGSLDADFTSEVISDLVGFTPQEIKQLKKEMSAKPNIQKRILEGLQKAQDKLRALNCLIELTMLEIPKITNLITFELKHVELLKKRFQSTGL